MIPAVNGKNVLFITTKNLDYIRNTQEIRLIKEQASSCTVIGSPDKHYFFRLLAVFFSTLAVSAARFDTVFIGFAPQLILPLFRYKFKKNYIIIDFFISMYDTLCHDRKKIKPGSAAGHFLHFIDRMTLSCADFVICDTNTHGRYFAEEFGVSPDKLYSLYLHADTSIYHPLPDCRPAHLKNKFIVLYFGSVLPLQGTSVVLEAMTLLKENKNLFFYFIGPVKKQRMTGFARHPYAKQRLTGVIVGKSRQAFCPVSDNIAYIDWLPQEQLAQYIGQADLCLAGHFHAEIAKAKRTIPGKAYIYKAMKKPMILGDNPANRELFHQNADTVFVEMGSAKALADAILAFYKEHTSQGKQFSNTL